MPENKTQTIKPLRVIHTFDESVRIERDGITLFDYHYRPNVDQTEGPKPFVHPLATPQGDVLTVDRPHDHVWHRGLNFGWSYVDEANFWGGSTFVKGQGYVQKHNNGTTRHDRFQRLEADEDKVYIEQDLTWLSVDGEEWITERRTFTVFAPTNDNELLLSVSTEVTPIPGVRESFRLSSPMIEGRSDPSGYSGLSLRLPRAFTGGTPLTSTGVEGPEAMGERATWLHFRGRVDESARHCGAAIFDHPENLRHPTYFFVRSTPFAIINPAFVWNEPYHLREGETLKLRYGVWLHTGQVNADQIEARYVDWTNREQS